MAYQEKSMSFAQIIKELRKKQSNGYGYVCRKCGKILMKKDCDSCHFPDDVVDIEAAIREVKEARNVYKKRKRGEDQK